MLYAVRHVCVVVYFIYLVYLYTRKCKLFKYGCMNMEGMCSSCRVVTDVVVVVVYTNLSHHRYGVG